MLILTLLGSAAAAAAIWQVLTHDTVPDFLTKHGWGLAVTSGFWYDAFVLIVGTGVVVLQIVLIRALLLGQRSKRPSASLVILAAKYGIDGNYRDVKTVLESYIHDDRIDTPVRHLATHGDPFPNQVKHVVVMYSVGGVDDRIVRHDGDQLTIPTTASPESPATSVVKAPHSPHVMVFTHDMAAVTGRLLSRQTESLFAGGGWEVSTHRTNLPQHASGVWLHGGTEAERASAMWGLKTLGVVDTKIDGTNDNPPALQVIIGQPDKPGMWEDAKKAMAGPSGVAFGDYEAVKKELRQCQEQVVSTRAVVEEKIKQEDEVREKLGTAETALIQYRNEIGVLRLERLRHRYPPQTAVSEMVVKFIDWTGDADFSDHIKRLFQQHTGWATRTIRELGSELRRRSRKRVIVESGNPELVKVIAAILNESDLLGEHVEAFELVDEPLEPARVIVTVFPKDSGA